MKKKKIDLIDVIAHLLLIILTCVFLYPILHCLAVSFSSNYYILAKKVTIFPMGFDLGSYKYMLEDNTVFRAFANAVYYTVIGVLCNVIFTALMAYPLSKTYLMGRSVILKLIMFTMYFSGGTIPTFLVVRDLHLLDSVWALVLPGLIQTMNMIVLINFFQSIPDSLYEAAYLDGASEYQVLRKVVVPLSKASLASIALFCFLNHWNSWFGPMIYLNDKKKFPLQLILRSMLLEATQTEDIYTMATAKITPVGIKNATIVLTMIPVLIVYPLAQKHFVKGVMVGGVKG